MQSSKKVAWFIRANQVVLHYVEGLTRRVLVPPSDSTTSEGYTATCQATVRAMVMFSNLPTMWAQKTKQSM